MTHEAFNSLIDSKFKEICEQRFTEEHIKAKLQVYATENGKINDSNIALFALIESVGFCKELIYTILSEVLPLDD